MKRHHLSGLLLLPLWAGCNTPAPDKPNVLWITFEDTSPQFIGCYGNRNAHTPEIDRRTASGVRFTHAFSTGTSVRPAITENNL